MSSFQASILIAIDHLSKLNYIKLIDSEIPKLIRNSILILFSFVQNKYLNTLYV